MDTQLDRAAWGTALRIAMARAGMDGKQLATASGMSPGAISHYRNGDRTPDIPHVRRLAAALGLSASELFRQYVEEAERMESHRTVEFDAEVEVPATGREPAGSRVVPARPAHGRTRSTGGARRARGTTERGR